MMKMRRLILTAIAALAVTAAASAENAPSKLADLAGTWSCVTPVGNTSTHTFTLNPDGSVDLKNELKVENAIPNTEHYAPQKNGGWAVDASFAGFKATAPAWTDAAWSVIGKMTAIPDQPQLKITYFSIDPTHFRREFAHMRDGAWTSSNSEVCTKS